jgi:hypothetical protein
LIAGPRSRDELGVDRFGHHDVRAPHYLFNCCLRTSRLIFSEIGRELARKLDMPLEKARKVIKIAKAPLSPSRHTDRG